MILLTAGLLPAMGAWTEAETNPDGRSLSELEERVAEIDAALDQLARSSLRSGVGAIGYRSRSHEEADAREWVEVVFDRAYPIDQIVLAPTLYRDSREGFQSDGFPQVFRVVAGREGDAEGAVIAAYDTEDPLLPRIAPVTIPVDGLLASWLRIEAIRLSRREFDGRHIFQLSELLVFSGARNIALRRPVTASSEHGRDLIHAWDLQYLVDGHTPYLMDAAQGEPSIAYIASVGRHAAFSLDLGAEHALSEIHLHAVDQSDTVPQAYPGNLGIPPHLLIEGARLPDFSDAVVLLNLRFRDLTDTGPVMMWPLPGTACRYVRIRCPDPSSPVRFGFAEIALYANGENIALHTPVHSDGQGLNPTRRSLAALTDGRNLYGNLLSVRAWMDQLARRHDLETERPLVTAELSRRYERQQRILRVMRWVAALCAGAVAFTILIDRMLRMRQATRMRERFAADLHDELGANIHTIGLLGDLARDATSRQELLELLDRSREFTERSGAAIRSWAQELDSRGLCEDLVAEMKRSAANLLADLDPKLTFEGEAYLQRLKPRKRIHIFLFYKECLTNILRHSGATRVDIRLQATPRQLTLTIADNGHGLNGTVPSSLKRRARLLGANLAAGDSTEGGTGIILTLTTSRLPMLQHPVPTPVKR